MPRQSENILLADVGGTHTRCAWLINRQPEHVRIYDNNAHTSIEDIFTDYLQETGRVAQVALLGIAGQISNGRMQMLHQKWSCGEDDIARVSGAGQVVLVNDFEALAYAVPFLPDSMLQPCGGGVPAERAAKAVIGPGTGLGVSGLVWSGTRWVALSGEGGHVTLAATCTEEEALCRFLRERYGRASAERAISGKGLADIYEFLGGAPLQPSDVSLAANAGEARALKALELLFGLLASTAGDLALTLGARGGVYIAGGVAQKNHHLIKDADFRRRFEAKGRYQALVRAMPVYWILDKAPALQGLAYLARHR